MDDWSEFTQAKRKQAMRYEQQILEEAAEACVRQRDWGTEAKIAIQIAERFGVANLMKRFYDQAIRHDFPNSRLLITPPKFPTPSYEAEIILRQWSTGGPEWGDVVYHDSGIRIIITPDNIRLVGWDGAPFASGSWNQTVDLKSTIAEIPLPVFKALAMETLQHCAPGTYGPPPPPEEQSPPSLVTRFLRWLSS